MERERSWEELADLDPPAAAEVPTTNPARTSRLRGSHLPPHRRRGRRAAVAMTLAATVALGYGVADAYDRVPGVLTMEPPHPTPQPVPVAAARIAAAPAPAFLSPDAPRPTTVQQIVDALVLDPRAGARVPGVPDGELAPPPDPATPDAPLTGLAAQQSVEPGSPPSVLVIDADSGEVLGQFHSDVPRVPASSLKVVTAAAVLATLAPQGTFTTELTLVDDHVLVLVGGGDVLLAPGEGDPGAVDGHAGLADLARQAAEALREQGVGTVKLRLDDTALPPEGLAPGLTPGDTQWVMPPAAVAVHQGLATGARAGDPGLQAAQLLVPALEAEGITVEGEVKRGASPDGAPVVATVESASVASLVRHALKESDNTVTENLARQMARVRGAATDRESVARQVTEVIQGLGVDTAGMVLIDVSGLSPHNRISADTLGQVLDLGLVDVAAPGTIVTGSARTFPALVTDLPVAGLDGTLDDRLAGPTAGIVRAKTGTLGAVASLTGTVLDSDGRLLVYVVIADGLPLGGVVNARAAIDEFVLSLSHCGCR